MEKKFYVARRNRNICSRCEYHFYCLGMFPCGSHCSGCGVCFVACPYEAVELFERENIKEVPVYVDNEKLYLPENVPIKSALESVGLSVHKGEDKDELCCTGGCWNCAVMVDGVLVQSCVTGVRRNMKIETKFNHEPVRGVGDFMVGGGGTIIETDDGIIYDKVEIVCLTCGCNLRCPQCFNWMLTYNSNCNPLTAKETARILVRKSRFMSTRRIAISGGESTLNKHWLLRLVREIKNLGAENGRENYVKVDTNGSTLTPEYVDKLIEEGVNEFTIDLKGLDIQTFMRITGLKSEELAEKYLNRAWNAVKYIIDKYNGKVMVEVGIPYNKKLISLEEMQQIGKKLSSIDNNVYTYVIDYKPAFRRRDLLPPSYKEMMEIYKLLKGEGLKKVFCKFPRE